MFLSKLFRTIQETIQRQAREKHTLVRRAVRTKYVRWPMKLEKANVFDRGHKAGVSRQRQRRAAQREAGTELALASGWYRQDEKGRLVRA